MQTGPDTVAAERAPVCLSLEIYAKRLSEGGRRVVEGSRTSLWVRYESMAMMRVPTFIVEPPPPAELARVHWQGPSLVAAYLLEPGPARPSNARLYVCRDKEYRVERLPVSARRDARRAARSLRIDFADWQTVLEEGLGPFIQTRRRVGLSDGTRQEFLKRMTRFAENPAHRAAGAWKNGVLVAFMTLVVVDDWVEIEGAFSTDADRGLCPNDGLASFVLRHYLAEGCATTVSYGLSSIQDGAQGAGLHAYKTKIGFEAMPVHRAFALHPWVKPWVSPVTVRGLQLMERMLPRNRMMKKATGMLTLIGES